MRFAFLAVVPLLLLAQLIRLPLHPELFPLLSPLACKKRKRRRYGDEDEDNVGVHSCACMQRLCSASRFVHRPLHTLFGCEQSIFLYIFHIRMASHAPW